MISRLLWPDVFVYVYEIVVDEERSGGMWSWIRDRIETVNSLVRSNYRGALTSNVI